MRTITRDYDIEEDIVQNEENFWNNYVKKGEEPPYIESADMVLEAIKKHYGENSGKNVLIPDEYKESVKKYLDLDKQKSELNKAIKEIANQIKEVSIPFMDFLKGNSGEIILDGTKYGVVYTTRTTYGIKADDLADLKLKYPDIYEAYVKPSISVASKVKELKEKK